ncbi:hypothetical protein [Fusobacterium nucleatum]|uniref:Uncharacterized protein n=1 Tax=Fusobacterium nucleatum subsp. nucleatum TaxID=76856 RepID=A0A0X3Y256_FUSNC|nr:hypothetical protein [Fusobacterium nucleatum]ALF24259.1 hypothetical protein RO05_07695 [Fusobacterium nucleatum subsp. nucleatum ChDC F316]ASG26460.1 hypothetical protein RN84_06175 [Fusobacterium nucleatum subsp. nucleatum]KUL98636.1 hypothetical protein RO03_03625 [Fusobacterium nucleatum subsp. nucleatum]
MKKIKYFLNGLSAIIKYAVSDTNSYLTQTSSYFIKDDNDALSKDWKIIGNDLRGTIDKYKKEFKAK